MESMNKGVFLLLNQTNNQFIGIYEISFTIRSRQNEFCIAYHVSQALSGGEYENPGKMAFPFSS